jgi:hypothetical protein
MAYKQPSPVASSDGGTGVNNGASTITLAGSLVTTGAYSVTLAATNTTGITLPTSGTLATTSQLPSTGTPLALNSGGTNGDLTASNGGIFYSTASAGAILAGTSTADQVLLSGSSTTPAWSTATYPATTTANQILYSSAANTIGGLATADSSVLVTSSSGTPSLSTTIPKGVATVGVTDASNATAGNIGEYMSSTVLAGSAVSVSNGSATNVTSINLTAGDWDVTGTVVLVPSSSTISNFLFWISTTSATLPTAPNSGSFSQIDTVTSTGQIALPTGPIRVNVSTTTTTYLCVYSAFSGGSNTAYGFIGARRLR